MIHPALASRLRSRPGATIVTAGLRLARAVGRYVAVSELDGGASTWQPPAVMPWNAWVGSLWESALYVSVADNVPSLMGAAQLRSIWREIVTARLANDARSLVNVDALVSACIDAERRLAQWRIEDDALGHHPMTEDMRFFAGCLARYRELQRRGSWLALHDIPRHLQATGILTELDLPRELVLAGFDRLTPDQRAFIDALAALGVETHGIDDPVVNDDGLAVDVVSCPTHDDELFAAGSWARMCLAERPDARVAIVVPALAGEAGRARRLVSETLFPGWQYRDRLTPGESLRLPEVSFGEPLSGYPAVAIALDLLDCALRGPRFRQLSRLLRSPLLGEANRRTGPDQELALRAIPDRVWSLADLAAWLGERGGEPAWLGAVRGLAALEGVRRPEQWAEAVDACLAAAEWLAADSPDSERFQLRNAWRNALNELGALGDTVGACTAARATLELKQIVSSTIYQPEGRDAAVSVLGPLEAMDLAFDAVRVVGLDAARWPPAARPLPLLPPGLQREHEMPDATASDTLQFARRILDRLCRAAPRVVLSWPRADGDEDLTASPLLADYVRTTATLHADERYAGSGFAGELVVHTEADPVEPMDGPFRARGGYMLLGSQRNNPFAAMVLGRLRGRALEEPASGPDGRVRGIVIHNALQSVYAQQPDSAALHGLPPAARATLIGRSVETAAKPYYVAADARLRRLLDAESARAVELIDTFVTSDLEREPFQVAATEQKRILSLAGLEIELRLDRVDLVDGRVWIIDYKTGRKVSRVRPDTLSETQGQLVAYALTEAEPEGLDALLLAAVNRDRESRFVGIADRAATGASLEAAVQNVDDFAPLLAAWHADFERLAGDFMRGDIRINTAVQPRDQRDIATLSRLFIERAEHGI